MWHEETIVESEGRNGSNKDATYKKEVLILFTLLSSFSSWEHCQWKAKTKLG